MYFPVFFHIDRKNGSFIASQFNPAILATFALKFLEPRDLKLLKLVKDAYLKKFYQFYL